MMNQPYSFSLITDLLLEWGKTALQEEKLPDYLAVIEKEIESEGELSKDSFDADISAIAEHSIAARNVIRDISIIGLTQDDWEWNDVLSSFDAFDMVVYMMAGVDGILRNKDNILAESLFNDLESQLEETLDLMFSDTFSSLRLVPFNVHRKIRLMWIEEPSRYLFPWYELSCHESPAATDELVSFYHYIVKDELPEHAPEYISENLYFYMHEIMRDKELNNYIHNENKLFIALGKTIEKHWALRLWSSAKKAGAKRLLPEKVESLGLSKVSATIFRKKRLSHSDQLVMEITRACYAPDIKEDKRLEIILKCEDRLKLLDDSDVVGTGAAHKCITDIIGLGKGELGADEAAESLLNFWIDRIEQVASEMSSEIMVEKIRGKVDDIIQTGKIIFESIPHPFYLAGQLATATDTLPQSKTFLLRTGEYIKISCDWKRPSKDYPSYLHLEWKANITTPGRIWARFINSDTGKKYKDTCLGNRLEGRRDFESDELGFDPTDEQWAISIIFERD